MSTQVPVFDITVVTVVRNGAAHLEQTIASVLAQFGARVEYVVIDGASTDGSVEIIRRHADGIASWISEPDRGIGDAMNKGLAHARGEWLLFLHADDYLASDGALAAALSHATPDADFIACALDYLEDGGARRRPSTGFTPWLNLKTTFLHQATLIRRSAFERLGPYDTGLRIAMDYEFFLRAARAGASAVLLPDLVLSCMRGSGISARRDWPTLKARFAEERDIHRRHASGLGARMFYRLWWLLYPGYRFTVERIRRPSAGLS